MEDILIGNHPLIQKNRELISMVSDTAFNVLILGETGTGKGVAARLLHRTSSRCNQSFIMVNCAALPYTLLESELFGYEKGAFTGASKSKPGKFEIASDGTILLDEIGDMPISIQAKLLQVLQSNEFNRLGGTKDIKVNTWVIACTNHDLEKDIKERRFREDLYFRLNIIKIEMPPLSKRKEDIPLLADYFIKKYQKEMNLDETFRLNGNLQQLFQDYHWPGNVRELSNIMLKLMVGEDPYKIKHELLKNMEIDALTREKYSSGNLKLSEQTEVKDSKIIAIRSLKEVKADASEHIEKRAIWHALNITHWNKRKAAQLLKISYKTLFYKMDNLGIKKTR